MKPVLVLQHMDTDGPGYLATWLQGQGRPFDLRNEQAGDVLPDDLARLLEASSRSELKVPLVVEGLDRPVNRLAYALVTAATIQGSSQLLARGTAPTYKETSIPGLVGTGVATYLAVQILRSIRRAGGV